MRLPVILLSTVLLVSGCEIFMDEWGAEGAPCGGQEDCQKHLVCEQNICRKLSGQGEFGVTCDPGNPVVCGGVFPVCACFPGNKCNCTRPCNAAHACDDVPGNGSTIRCTLLDFFGLQGVCADWQWTSSYGNLCIPGDIECDNGLCATFQAESVSICTTACTVGCPEGFMCEPPVEPQQGVCGYAFWFGFWLGCGSNMECDERSPQFPICKDNQNCTKNCASDGDCPVGAHCDNPPTGDCVPDM